MISHALKILVSELNTFFEGIQPAVEDTVVLGNIATMESPTGTDNAEMRDKVVMTLVNLREEKTLKNSPYSFANSATLKTEYFNPPVFVNLFVLFSATANKYEKALTYLSRLIRFFQTRNIFTHLNSNLAVTGEFMEYDRLSEFKLIVDLYSPTFEELNHLWGTLGGKQYPSVLYLVRLLELKQETVTEGGSLILETNEKIGHKTPVS
ncbi:DUF4255 domain-containing protein [Rufibacter psychrotolerans]|uniref:DUF4255 domain-containing protein n=1 Tax=Rufibacter psychrotolerans TaxID=2812556 RepID=UPI001967EC28|nr:DUF4255 domain-containing protein [Rufibacter sp. SYSU D00308]